MVPQVQSPCLISDSRTCKPERPTNLVFVIGPSSREFLSDINKIKGVLKGVGLEGYFASMSKKEKGLDIFCDKICTKIMSSIFCIAVLNDPVLSNCEGDSSGNKENSRVPRANVYYEYGLAVAMGKKVIPVARGDMKPPFDVQQIDTVRYENQEDLQTQLIPILVDTLTTIKNKETALRNNEIENAEAQIKEKPSDTFKEKFYLVGLPALLLMLFLPFRLAEFWLFGFGLFNLFNLGTMLFVFVFVVVFAVGSYIFGRKFLDPLLRTIRNVAVPYLVIYAFFVIAVAILNLGVNFYPNSTKVFFEVAFPNFLLICLVDLLIMSITVTLLNFPMKEYYASLENEKYEPNPKIEFGELLKSFGHYIKLSRKKLPVMIILFTFVLAGAIVPLDRSYSLFTPSYQYNSETFSHEYYPSDTLYLFIISNSTIPTVTSEYRFYRLAQTQYTIRPAKLPLSSSVFIPNPTNITSGSINLSYLYSEPSDYVNWWSRYNYTNIGNVFVNVSKSVTYDFLPQINNFNRIDFNVSGVSEPLAANLIYWKQMVANVSILGPTPIYTDLGNQTTLEKYTYVISNNEKIPLIIRSLDFDSLNWDNVNVNTTKIYVNGDDWYGRFPPGNPIYVEQYAILNLEDVRVEAGQSLNLTLTFQSSYNFQH